MNETHGRPGGQHIRARRLGGVWVAGWALVALVALMGWAQASPVEVWPSPRRVTPDASGQVAFELVAVNVGLETARDVSLTDRLPPETELVWASPAPRRVGDRLEWSLGALAPGHSARVQVVLRGADLGAQVDARIGGTRRTRSATPVLIVDDPAELTEALRPTPDADAADPEVLAVVAAHEGQTAALLDHVRESIRLEL